MLTTQCSNTNCSASFQWSANLNIGRCVCCNEQQSQYQTPSVPFYLRDELGLLSGLIDPNPHRRQAALAAVDPQLHGTDRGHLFELALACASICSASHDDQSNSGEPDMAELWNLARGAAMLKHWPDKLNAFIRKTQPGTPETAVLRKFRSLTWSASTPEVVRVLLHQACPDLVRTSGPYPALVSASRKAQERITAREFAAEAKIKRSEVGLLVDKGLLDAIDVGGRARRHRWFQPEDAAEIRYQLDNAVSIRQVTSQTGLHLPAIEQLVEHEVLGRYNRKFVSALRHGLHIEAETLRDYMADMQRLGVATGDGWVLVSHVIKSIGGQEKPVGEIIAAGLYGKLALAYAPDASPGTAVGLMVKEAEFKDWINDWWARKATLAASTGIVHMWRSPYVSHLEAMEHLQVQPREYKKGFQSQLTVAGVGGLRTVCRDKLHELGRQQIGCAEISARLKLVPREVSRLLRTVGLKKISPVQFWSRPDYRAMEQELLTAAEAIRYRQLAFNFTDHGSAPAPH